MDVVVRIRRSILQLDAWTSIEFQNAYNPHELKLMQLWNNLMPNTKLKERNTM